MTTLDEIGDAARVLSERRARLRTLVEALTRGLEALKTDSLPEMRVAITEATQAWESLRDLVEANPQLFKKPRTVALHGIKVGFEKGKGGLEIVDPDRTVALIRKHLPDQADVLIATKEAPAKDALAQLSAEQLKKVGVNVKGTGDQVVIRPADGEIDKLVKALVKAQIEEDG
ncbi:hypothetical protein [Caldimonas sp. KR1-144]|uniref:hypothetical protein n=1 Tax=Caldimonas sp. KR1-144 TaxID=3400911 RepID=UPI003C03A837